MARNSGNLFTSGNRGAVGKQVVFKEINGKTFATKYPDMSGVVYNKTQKKYQNVFKEAVKFARSIKADPAKVDEYHKKIHNNKKSRRTSVYSFAIQEFMKQHSSKVPKYEVQKLLREIAGKFSLTDRQVKGIRQVIAQGSLTNSTYQRLNNISKPTATRDLQALVKMGILSCASKGAGALYSLVGFAIPNDDDDEVKAK